MQRKLTIWIAGTVYEGLHGVVVGLRISRFFETLLKPRVLRGSLLDAHRKMAQDEERESEALEWAEATLGDVAASAR